MLQFASNIREKKILDRIWSKDHNNIMFYGSLMISTPGHLYDYFVLKWIEDPPKIQKIQMTQYNFIQYLEYGTTTSPKTVIGVEIILCRKLDYYIMNIYIPTFCLIIIAGMMLFIDYSHFEVNIMVALSSMLVTYTLYQSISDNFPNTA